MKTVYCFSIFVYILLLSRDTNGGLVRGFFEKVHDAAHKVHEDIHNAFHPTEKPKETVAVADLPDNKNDEPIVIFVTSPVTTTSTTTTAPKEIPVDQTYKPTEKVEEAQFVFASNPTPQPVVGSTSTEKDGKENFFGGCSTGYRKTADGRCKPTF